MSSWGEGYVTDTSYISSVHGELSPAHLAFAAALSGQAAPDVTEPLTYCDLGCGQGLTTNLMAAAYPHIEFHGNDFNPAHVVGARRLAAETGLANAHFYEDSFEEFLHQPKLPEAFDIIVLHGIYSWISPDNRAHVRRFIRQKLRPGGLVYLSYNALPGWSALAPIRRFMQLQSAGGGSTAARLSSALDSVRAASAADMGYFKRNPGAKAWLDKMAKSPPAYLAHEYFNENWTLYYHADLVAEVAEAKLDYIGTATVIDTLDGFNIAPAHAEIIAKAPDSATRETLRDFAMNQQFRRDLFVKGATGLTPAEMDGKWARIAFALVRPRREIELSILGALGRRTLSEAIADPILDALAAGPKTLVQLLEDARVASLGAARVLPTLTALVGSGQAIAVLRDEHVAERRRRTDAFNAAMMRRARVSPDARHLASPLGCSFGIERIGMLLAVAHAEGAAEPDAFVWDILKPEGRRLMKDDAVLQSDEDNRAELRARYETFKTVLLPVLQGLQIL
jgi:SAM-dependent methyltransferase